LRISQENKESGYVPVINWFLLLLTSFTSLAQQPYHVNGQILDADKNPMSGVLIEINAQKT
jgi:hypothetical protein